MCLFENNFSTKMSCRPVPLFFSGFNALASSGTYLIRPVLTSNFTSFRVGSGNFSSCTISFSVFSRSASFLQCSEFVFHKHPRFFIKSSISGVCGHPSI
jgi:hypothetical protein